MDFIFIHSRKESSLSLMFSFSVGIGKMIDDNCDVLTGTVKREIFQCKKISNSFSTALGNVGKILSTTGEMIHSTS